MMHQYIGARYVPYYYENSLDPTSTEWEPNVSYEPLTVVTLPNLHSYISKKYVPDTIGSPALNAEYWLDRGYDNAYIQALQDEVNDMKDGDVAGSLQNQINLLNTKAVKLDNIVLVGDSYAQYYVNDLLSYTGANNFFNASAGGASFSGINGYPTFKDNLQNLVITSEERAAIKTILVVGGINDCNDPISIASVQNAMIIFDTYVKTNYPNAQIILAFVGGQSYVNVVPDVRHGYDQRTMIRTYISMAGQLGWNYMTNSEYIMKNYLLYNGDGLHPNTNGGKEIAKQLVLGLMTGSCDVHYYIAPSSVPVTYETDVSNNYTDRIIYAMYIDNDVTTIILNRMLIHFTNNSYQQGGIYNSKKILSFDGTTPFLACDEHYAIEGTTVANQTLVEGGVSSYGIVPLKVELFQGGLYFTSQDPINKAGTALGNGYIEYYQLVPTKITCNTIFL